MKTFCKGILDKKCIKMHNRLAPTFPHLHFSAPPPPHTHTHISATLFLQLCSTTCKVEQPYCTYSTLQTVMDALKDKQAEILRTGYNSARDASRLLSLQDNSIKDVIIFYPMLTNLTCPSNVMKASIVS